MKSRAMLVLAAGVLAASATGLVTPVRAQGYPAKPVRLVVSVQPGGNLDLIGRAVADRASEGLGQRMFVENRPGANSTIGLASVARAAPDGYTLVMVAQSALVAPKMMRNPPFDPVRDFAGVSLIATLPQALVVHPSLPMKFDNLSTSLTNIRAGRLRALGVTAPTRTALLPEVPAIAETLPGFQASIFNGMMAPAATPQEILNRMHAEIVKFVQAPEIRSRFANQGVELQSSATPAQFTAFIKAEYERWGKVLDEAGIKPE